MCLWDHKSIPNNEYLGQWFWRRTFFNAFHQTLYGNPGTLSQQSYIPLLKRCSIPNVNDFGSEGIKKGAFIKCFTVNYSILLYSPRVGPKVYFKENSISWCYWLTSWQISMHLGQLFTWRSFNNTCTETTSIIGIQRFLFEQNGIFLSHDFKRRFWKMFQ